VAALVVQGLHIAATNQAHLTATNRPTLTLATATIRRATLILATNRRATLIIATNRRATLILAIVTDQVPLTLATPTATDQAMFRHMFIDQHTSQQLMCTVHLTHILITAHTTTHLLSLRQCLLPIMWHLYSCLLIYRCTTGHYT
jgi:hypothetical protein